MRGKITTFLLLFFVFSFLFKTDHSFDQDLGRHIKLGEIITKTFQVPSINLFSYTNPDFPFINTHWFFEVLAYFFSQTVGLSALLVLKIIILLLSVWIVLKIIPKENTTFLLPIGFIFLHVLRERVELRPEIFSFLFTALTYYILEKFLKQIPSDRGTFVTNSKLIFLLPVIQLIWINTHIYFFVGLILQVIFLIHTGYQYLCFNLRRGLITQGGYRIKISLIIFILSVLVMLINPNGLSGVLYPLNVTTNYGYTIVENQTMFLLEGIGFRDPNFLFVKLSATIIAIALFVAFIKRQMDLRNILLSLVGLSLALLNVRSFPYLIFLSLPAALINFGKIKKNGFTTIISTFFVILLLLESLFYLNGSYYKYTADNNEPGLKLVESGKNALDYVYKNNLPNPIFNNFDIGSYIIYRSYPSLKVFVDGRPEGYPKEFFQETYIPMQADYSKFKEMEKKYGFKTIIFSHTDQTPWGRAFLQSVVKDRTWKIVFIDDFMIVLVKDNVANENKLEAIDLAKLDPNLFKFDGHLSYLKLGLFLLNTQNIEGGKKFIEKTLQLFPNDPIANSLIGNTPKNNFFW